MTAVIQRFQSSVSLCSEDVVGPLSLFYLGNKKINQLRAISERNNLLLVPIPREGRNKKQDDYWTYINQLDTQWNHNAAACLCRSAATI